TVGGSVIGLGSVSTAGAQTYNGNATLSGNLTTGNGGVTVTGGTVLLANTIINTSAGGGAVNLQSLDASGGFGLTIQAGNGTVALGAVGQAAGSSRAANQGQRATIAIGNMGDLLVGASNTSLAGNVTANSITVNGGTSLTNNVTIKSLQGGG